MTLIKQLVLFIYFLPMAYSQVEPAKSLHRNPPRTWALTNATIFLEPGKIIYNSTIIIRNGLIESVGKKIAVPIQASILDMSDKYIYPGFIEGWLNVNSTANDTSLEAHWNSNMRAHLKSSDIFQPNEIISNQLRALGFTSAHIAPKGGIFEGVSGLIQLTKKPKVLSNNVAQVIDYYSGGWGANEYPTSLLGSISFIRQGFIDSDWYSRSVKIIEKYPDGNEQIQIDRSLDNIAKSLKNNKPFIFRTKNELYIDRSAKIADEFKINYWIKGNGYEYRRIEKLPKSFMIIPMNFPGNPNVSNINSSLEYSLEQLKHWDKAPENARALAEADFNFALTSDGLKNKNDFRKNLIKAVSRGLDQKDALSALTTSPAKAFGESKRLGKIQPGFIANLVIASGNYFDEKTIINSVWIGGDEYYLDSDPVAKVEGKWTLKVSENNWTLNINKIENSYQGKLKYEEKNYKLNSLKINDDRITFFVKSEDIFKGGVTRFNGSLLNSSAEGSIIYSDGTSDIWTGSLESSIVIKPKPAKNEKPSSFKLTYPEGAYGLDSKLPKPNSILIDGATIWTSGPRGILKNYDILFQNGKIKQIAKNIYMPNSNVLIIDGKNKHITPGLIDAHSHMAGESINEGFQNVTAEVRMQDVIDPNDIAIYRALAGGLTTINLLHGSANPIGGQNVVMKLRWGSFSEDLIFKKAPQGIKFALGENVKRKRSYGRYPETRMGVEQVIRDAFTAARDYKKNWQTYNKDSKLQRSTVPPRRDLELDAIVEIMEGKRLLHAHSYRQDEILMLTRIAEDFGFTIATFQHVLEGYKVADRLAEHGAGASTFSDWWAYKYEVIDAIPFNGALMSKVGVNVSFNSDSDELARRMNLEAAKAVKYGGLSEEDALKFVTINPAKQLKIDKYVGSLEIGKDADFAIWSGHPLSNYSICEQTWLDGVQHFSLDQDRYFRNRDKKVRNDIIQKILESPPSSASTMKPNVKRGDRFNSCDAFESYIEEKSAK